MREMMNSYSIVCNLTSSRSLKEICEVEGDCHLDQLVNRIERVSYSLSESTEHNISCLSPQLIIMDRLPTR